MIKNVFNIYDSQTKLFDDRLIVAINQHDCIRSISTIMEDKTTRFFKHADDLSLYHVGDLDCVTGVITALQEPFRVLYFKELVKPESFDDRSNLLEAIKKLVSEVSR